VSFSFDPSEKPFSKREFALSASIIAVHNSGNFLTGSTIPILQSVILIIVVRNSFPKVFFT
jgi:hypothetical protein